MPSFVGEMFYFKSTLTFTALWFGLIVCRCDGDVRTDRAALIEIYFNVNAIFVVWWLLFFAN